MHELPQSFKCLEPKASDGAEGGRGFNIITAYIQSPRFSGDSPKEIHLSNQRICFGEKGAGKRKIGAHRRFYVYLLVECRVISQYFVKII